MEQEQRRSKSGSYLVFFVVVIVASANGLIGVEMEEVADDLLTGLGRIIQGMGSDPPEPTQA